MPTNLTGQRIKNIYSQLLHVSGGLSATRTTVSGGTGTASALALGTDNVAVDNILFDGNTISTLDTNGNLTLSPNGTGAVAIAKAAITGGTISGLTTPLPIASGGTGGATASAARAALGLLGMAEQAASAVAITGGSATGLTSVSAASVRATSTLGFSTGAGGTVTQSTSKATGVTLDYSCGTITMNNASLASDTSVSFTLTNSQIGAEDVVVVNIKSGGTASSYVVTVGAVAAGSCVIHVRNVSGGPLGEALVLSFAVIKAVAA